MHILHPLNQQLALFMLHCEISRSVITPSHPILKALSTHSPLENHQHILPNSKKKMKHVNINLLCVRMPWICSSKCSWKGHVYRSVWSCPRQIWQHVVWVGLPMASGAFANYDQAWLPDRARVHSGVWENTDWSGGCRLTWLGGGRFWRRNAFFGAGYKYVINLVVLYQELSLIHSIIWFFLT